MRPHRNAIEGRNFGAGRVTSGSLSLPTYDLHWRQVVVPCLSCISCFGLPSLGWLMKNSVNCRLAGVVSQLWSGIGTWIAPLVLNWWFINYNPAPPPSSQNSPPHPWLLRPERCCPSTQPVLQWSDWLGPTGCSGSSLCCPSAPGICPHICFTLEAPGNRLKDSHPSKRSAVDVQRGSVPILMLPTTWSRREERRQPPRLDGWLLRASVPIGALWPWNRSLCSSGIARRCKGVRLLAVVFNCVVSLQVIWQH